MIIFPEPPNLVTRTLRDVLRTECKIVHKIATPIECQKTPIIRSVENKSVTCYHNVITSFKEKLSERRCVENS